MPTSIYKYDGSLLTILADSTLDSTTASLRFPGKGYQNYGQPIMENLVWLLQNFAGTTAPSLPLAGQCWYDTTTKTIKVYNGLTWDSSGGVTVAGSAPLTASSQGELWFDNVNQQLFTWNGTGWALLGPLGSSINSDPLNKPLPSNSAIDSVRISDGTTNHQVWRITVGGTLLAIISKDATFTPSPSITGFASINPGINLNSNIANNGVTGATNAFTNNKTNTPSTDLIYDLGSITNRFANFYTNNGFFNSAIAINAAISSYTLEVGGDTYLNGGVTIKGSNNVAPILVQTTSLTASPVPGAIEFDGNDFYLTSNAAGTINRVAITSSQNRVGNIFVSNSTASTSTTTGAIVTPGGAGIGGNIHVGGEIHYYGNVLPVTGTTTTQIVVPNNATASIPGLAWGTNRNTGVYAPNATSLAIGINGTEVFRVSASGAIGLGASNNNGVAGQVLTSAGTGNPAVWANITPTPAGAVIAFAGQTAPSGWLLCQGQAVSRTVYADLFAAIGTTYGVGDNTTTFNLPDLRGEFIRGFDAGRGVDTGRVFGTAQTDAFQGHGHALRTQSNGPGGGTGTYATGTVIANDRVTDPVVLGANGTPRIAAETRPRNIAMQYIIKI